MAFVWGSHTAHSSEPNDVDFRFRVDYWNTSDRNLRDIAKKLKESGLDPIRQPGDIKKAREIFINAEKPKRWNRVCFSVWGKAKMLKTGLLL